VIQKLPEFRFRVGNQLIRPRRVEIYRVVEDHGRELMISVDAKGLKGLVESDQVIAVEHALDFLGLLLACEYLASRKKGS
jgi:hypothetical protein